MLSRQVNKRVRIDEYQKRYKVDSQLLEKQPDNINDNACVL
jgi:hypothetical protein